MVTEQDASHFLAEVVGRTNAFVEALRVSASDTEFPGKAILVSYVDRRGASVIKVFPVSAETERRSVTVLVAHHREVLGALQVSVRDFVLIFRLVRSRVARMINLRREDSGSLPFGVGTIVVELADLETVRRLLLERQTRVSDAQEVER